MKDLMRYAAELERAGDDPLPPVEQWRPEREGEIDIVIEKDGAWVHEGGPIRRARLARLFSTILRREGDDYFLVTPAEKLRIRVEDAPFVAVLMKVEGAGENQRIAFTTNLGDVVALGPDHPLTIATAASEGEAGAPYIEVRNGLKARIARAVFYDLAELSEPRVIEGAKVFGVWSAGEFFVLGPAGDKGPDNGDGEGAP